MATCPQCQQAIQEDFGLVTCTNCGASLFIEMDGQVVSNENSVTPSSGDFQSEEAAFVDESLGAFEAEGFSETQQEGEVPFEIQESLPPLMEELSEVSAVDPVAEDAFEEVPFEEMESVIEEAPIYSTESPPPLNEVLEYANSDVSQGKEGPLTYTLLLKGIDTVDLRNEVKEALTDKRLLWDTEALIKSITNGELSLNLVSAVKAYIVVSRLIHLPIEIEWIQQNIHQV